MSERKNFNGGNFDTHADLANVGASGGGVEWTLLII